jgi:hypothetical protein
MLCSALLLEGLCCAAFLNGDLENGVSVSGDVRSTVALSQETVLLYNTSWEATPMTHGCVLKKDGFPEEPMAD